MIAAFCSGNCLCAQTYERIYSIRDTLEVPKGYELIDTVMYIPVSAVDTSLAGRNIFRILENSDEARVTVNQSPQIEESMSAHIEANGERTISGYRVRIFFDNKQTARTESENITRKFNSLFPDVMSYRIYANPYFKVTVGDFRTKSEAMALLIRIRDEFPSAFVVKENIKYPVVDTENAVLLDSVRILRPIKESLK